MDKDADGSLVPGCRDGIRGSRARDRRFQSRAQRRRFGGTTASKAVPSPLIGVLFGLLSYCEAFIVRLSPRRGLLRRIAVLEGEVQPGAAVRQREHVLLRLTQEPGQLLVG